MLPSCIDVIAGSASLKIGPRVTPMRQSIYKRYDYSKHSVVAEASPQPKKLKEVILSSAQSSRRVARPGNTRKSPATRTPKTDQKLVRGNICFGRSPKTIQVRNHHKLSDHTSTLHNTRYYKYAYRVKKKVLWISHFIVVLCRWLRL